MKASERAEAKWKRHGWGWRCRGSAVALCLRLLCCRLLLSCAFSELGADDAVTYLDASGASQTQHSQTECLTYIPTYSSSIF